MIEKYIIDVFIFVLGAVVGSFLNVCIVRMPHTQSIVYPGSHCVHCKKPILWYDNIPLLSYIFLGGKCRFCKKKISFRYFIVELVTAVSFLIFYRHFGFDIILWPYLLMLCGFIIATFVDMEHRIIPDEISVGGIVVGIILSALIPELHDTSLWTVGLWRSLLGVLIGGGAIYAMGLLGDFIFKKESMGGGDVKLLAMMGAFLGWQMAVLTFFVAPIFGALAGIIIKIRTKESVIPYGPFLVIGALVSLFWAEPIVQWILSGYGLN